MARTGTSPDGDRPSTPGPAAALPWLLGLAQRGTIEESVRRVFAPHLSLPSGKRFWDRWRGTLRLLWPLGHTSQGNVTEVFVDGDRAFEAMWQAMRTASKRVLFETYILEPDRVGRRSLAELLRARRRGLDVAVVVDAFGSSAAAPFLKRLRRAGVRVERFNPILRWSSRLSRLVRNHRKILVCDGVGFCGGMNVSEDYAGRRLGTHLFRDTHLRLEGPCVEDLAALVEEHFGGDGRGPGAERVASPVAAREKIEENGESVGALVQILESNVRRQRRAIQRALETTVQRSVERCYLTTPYFVPPPRLVRALRRAAARGVDVRVLTAGRSDVPLVRLASRHLYGRLLRKGVRLFEMEERVLHAKTATVDGVYSTIGSFNLDYWSYRRNLEVNVSILDGSIAEQLEERFQRDVELSSEVPLERWRKRSWLERIVQRVAYWLMRI